MNDHFIVSGICWVQLHCWILAASAIICPTHKPCYAPRQEIHKNLIVGVNNVHTNIRV